VTIGFYQTDPMLLLCYLILSMQPFKCFKTHLLNVLDQKTELSIKTGEISELKIKIDDLKLTIARENQAKDELQRHYQQRLKEKQTEIESYRW